MRGKLLKIGVALLCTAVFAQAAVAQDLILTGNDQGLWLVRSGGGDQGFDVAVRPTSLPWQQVTREHPGTVSAAVAVGKRLHVLLHGPMGHLIFRADGAEPLVARNPKDPRWPAEVKPLAAFEGRGLIKDAPPTIVAVVLRPPGATQPASATAPSQPATRKKCLMAPLLTASITLSATLMTALWPKPHMTSRPFESSPNPGMARAFSITGAKFLSEIWRTPGQPTSPVVKMLSL